MRTWAFLHIPKAGGTSLTSALARGLGVPGPAKVRFDRTLFGTFDRFDELSAEIRTAIAVGEEEVDALRGEPFVAGHLCLPSLRRVAASEQIVTLLREPRARLLSQYAFWRQQSDEANRSWHPYRFPESARRPLAEFLENREIAVALDNVICRLALGPDARLPIDGFCDPADVAAVSSDAIARLEDVRHVGILERGASTERDLATAVGVPLSIGRENVTRGRHTGVVGSVDLGEATARLLDARSAADAQVYRHFAAAALGGTDQADAIAQTAFLAQIRVLASQLGRASP